MGEARSGPADPDDAAGPAGSDDAAGPADPDDAAGPAGSGDRGVADAPGSCAGCGALQDQVRTLRAEVARLRAEKAALLRAAAARDYERPPHYL